jgi:hypothetical protein
MNSAIFGLWDQLECNAQGPDTRRSCRGFVAMDDLDSHFVGYL